MYGLAQVKVDHSHSHFPGSILEENLYWLMSWTDDDQYVSGVVEEIPEDCSRPSTTIMVTSQTFMFSTETLCSCVKVLASAARVLMLTFDTSLALQTILEDFGNKIAWCFPPRGSHNKKPCFQRVWVEETEFRTWCRCTWNVGFAADAYITSSKKIYKVKVDEDLSLFLKARLALHWKEDSLKCILKNAICIVVL